MTPADVLDKVIERTVAALTADERAFVLLVTPWWLATSTAALAVGACFPPR